MKLRLFSPDAKGEIDPTITGKLLRFIPFTESGDVTVVPISYLVNYRFNERLYDIQGPIAVMDFLEFGWQHEYVLQYGTFEHWPAHYQNDQWSQFDKWMTDRKPELLFKRELHLRYVTERVIPIEFPCAMGLPQRCSKEEFESRPMEVFFCWGMSHHSRQELHGAIFRNAFTSSLHILDHWTQDGKFEGRKNWASIFVPHYNRVPIANVLDWQHRAKISVSLRGAGVKCFRSAESCHGSVMALHQDELSWSFPWLNGVNCIRLRGGAEFKDLLDATYRRDLHEIYMNGMDNLVRYHAPTYAGDYIIPSLQRIA